MSSPSRIGERIAAIRENRHITRETLAEYCGYETDVITHIEETEYIPSLTPLIKIARCLGVRLGTLLDDEDNLGPVVTRAGQREKSFRFSEKGNPHQGDLDFYSLAADKMNRHMEPFIVDVYPTSAEEIHLSSHEGEEFILVLDGEITILYGQDTFHLKPMDSIYYDSIVKHHVHSANQDTAKILAVVYMPN